MSKLNKKKYSNADKCTHCGYCLPVCPTYRVENQEMQSPRGRVSIVLAMVRGAIPQEQAVEALSHCISCRACHGACPVGVRPGKLALQARSLAPLKPGVWDRLLHWITDSPKRTTAASHLLSLYVRSGLQALLRPLFKLVPPFARFERLIPAHRPLAPRMLPQPPADAPVVALLGGCMARLFLPHVGMSAKALLQSLGYRVVTPKGFGCCGAPSRENGDREGFQRSVRSTLDAFGALDGVEAVITDSSVCTITARSYDKTMARDVEYKELAEVFSAKVMDLSTFLAEHHRKWQQAADDPGLGVLGFHDHCQLRHGLGTVSEPRALLQQLPVPAVEIPGDGFCCGAGGTYMLRYPSRSRAIRDLKLGELEASGAETIVAGNPGCLINLQAGLAEEGSPVKVRHMAEVLWQARKGNLPIS
uniref:Glycolate oxidase iron-sulfur subunit n=1 Tax=Magnetococcus massalia (strain MO-1) TaxID=451514 RepID=A0A1S7LLU9_MAGMO|nr:Conserved protein of unknown function. Putative Fe-S oxidoreductase [Candidatus Magnetococcus massalia]